VGLDDGIEFNLNGGLWYVTWVPNSEGDEGKAANALRGAEVCLLLKPTSGLLMLVGLALRCRRRT
jgi:hypothetical protein